ncbi:response regulator transcription factor [Streptomyces olivaceus]|uniref:response regulator transcription factor n=1 Tax=Streptomyces TaxID=1883 RepID=UPI001CCDB449|nr:MULTISPECIES: response regulator transcription factor [Streptomyces]MBZ6138216.1 response regulator transcription factor [Streptomyces olivaceus]MBZ6167935.1 response regulator transcription factor [Streptomyces olivaceus]MBZ6173231.1 response regulator transcription factor [Streptomyces olivaceus]MBZ6183599.1 response regulator transcription factor [Streptomyces olivaceus]MBZ6255995.1 response regulator transcription factor [Streptomyces olivaceus]
MHTHNPWRLLLVEDDPELVTMLSEVLRDEGYEVEVANDGQRGLHLGLTRQYDVLVVDRRLPALDGLDVLARLRSRAVRTPVMLLTAMGTVHDRVDGLDAGADDYLVKPFELDELSARLRALCRRALDRADVLRIGSGQLHVGPREVELADGERIALAAREFALLWVLASRPGTVYSRAELRRAVFQEAPASSIVDTYVYYLRRKLGRQAVHTVRGLGYRLGAL